MLTLNEQPKSNSKNLKLILSTIASTAIIGSATYYMSSLKNEQKSNAYGSKFLNMMPDEFSGEIKLRGYDRYGFNNHNSTGFFNKFNDDNDEWTLEYDIQTDNHNTKTSNGHYLLNDRQYQTKNGHHIDCVDIDYQIGYAHLKNSILQGVEVDFNKLGEETLKRSRTLCTEETTNIIIESEDYGALLICVKSQNKNQMSGGVFGAEWEMIFKTSSEKNIITVPHQLQKAFYYQDDVELGCKPIDKFQTINELDIKRRSVKNHKFEIKANNFPFSGYDRKLQFDMDMRIDESNETEDREAEENFDFDGGAPAAAPNQSVMGIEKVKCVWVHGAGNQKGVKKDPDTKIYLKNSKAGRVPHYWTNMVDPNSTYENETVWHVPGDYQVLLTENNIAVPTLDTYLDTKNTSLKQWPATWDKQPNGSSRFWSFEDEPFYGHIHDKPFARETFYPFFIRGNVAAEGHNNHFGILYEECWYGKFWYANSSMRIYNNSDVEKELYFFNCPGHEFGRPCTIGPESDTTHTVYFTHSYGGMITMQGFSKGNFTKGSKFVWAAAQSPFRGSAAGNAAHWICQSKRADGGLSLLLEKNVHKGVWATLRTMNYCNNKMEGSNYTHGLMLGIYEYERRPNATLDFTTDHGFIQYKYCGNHPAGMLRDVYWTNGSIGDNIYDVSLFSWRAGSTYQKEFGNDISLWLISYWSCRFFRNCISLKCNSNNSNGDHCNWRGCNSFLCKTHSKQHWKNSRFDFQDDGMVSISSCLGDHNDQSRRYLREHEEAPLGTGIEGVMDPADKRHYSSVFIAGMGKTFVTEQTANHEDGTGTNGNSHIADRCPINWYVNVVINVQSRGLTQGNHNWASIEDNLLETDASGIRNENFFMADTNKTLGGFSAKPKDHHGRLNGKHYYQFTDYDIHTGEEGPNLWKTTGAAIAP